MATVTLLYAAESTGSGYNTISGSATFTLSGGETLAIVMIGFSTSDVGAPTDSAGTLVKQTAAYNAFVGSGQTHGGWYTEANAAAGSHTITPPTISGGSDGLIGVLKIDGMPSTLNIRDAVKKQQITSSNTFALTTTGTPQVGDVVVGARWHENSVGSTDTITRPSGWTGLWQYLNGSVNLPTDNSYVILGSSGNFTATWTDVDPAITDTTGALLVLVPNAVGPTINTQPANQFVANGAAATFTVSATTSGGSLSYQWQDNSSGSFADIGGATSASLTVVASAAMNGRLYRVNVTDSNGTTTSSSATLFVTSITAAWPPKNIPLFPPFKRAKSTLWLLDPSNWGGASLNVGKWFADEMPTGAASPNVTKALTGVNATGQVGTVVSNVSYAITGNQASGQVGTVTNAVSYAFTGNAATGQVGTVVSNVTYGLTGVQATGQVGTVSYANDITLALTGVSATGQVGTLIPNVAYALTGNQAAGQVGTVTNSVSYALTGIAATGNVGAVVSNITYGLTGNQATGQVGTVSAGNDVTFALTGVEATGNVGAVTPNITYALTGVQASGQVGSVTASPSYGITGNQATGQVGTLTSAVAYGLTGVEGTGQVGNVSVPGDVTIALTGVQATGYVGDLLLQIASNVPAGGSGGYEHEAAIIRYRRAVAQRQLEAEIAAKAKADADEAQQRLNTANTKRQREKEARIIEKLRSQEEAARTLEEQLMVEIELLQRAILGANAQQTAMQAEEEEFALMFALTTLI